MTPKRLRIFEYRPTLIKKIQQSNILWFYDSFHLKLIHMILSHVLFYEFIWKYFLTSLSCSCLSLCRWMCITSLIVSVPSLTNNFWAVRIASKGLDTPPIKCISLKVIFTDVFVTPVRKILWVLVTLLRLLNYLNRNF